MDEWSEWNPPWQMTALHAPTRLQNQKYEIAKGQNDTQFNWSKVKRCIEATIKFKSKICIYVTHFMESKVTQYICVR